MPRWRFSLAAAATAVCPRRGPGSGDDRTGLLSLVAGVFRQAVVAVVTETDGFVVVADVGTGEHAVEAWPRLQPDLVLMDVNLPGIDGVEATK